MVTCEYERSYQCYVIKGDGYLLTCVKATIFKYLLILYVGQIGEIGVEILNGDYRKALLKKID